MEKRVSSPEFKLFQRPPWKARTPVAFGAAAISGEGGGYGFGEMDEAKALDLLAYAWDRGLRVFDAAPIYGYGLAEKRLGLAFSKRREDVFLISKSGVTWHDSGRVNRTNDPHVTERMLIQSLRDFRSEYIDLYFIHWPDSKVDIRRPMEILAEAQYQGKIKHIGLCNTHEEDLRLASEVAKIEVVQSEFNFLKTDAKKLFTYFNEKQISFMGWGTFDKGILSGTVTRNRQFEAIDARSWAPWWKSQNKETKFQKVEFLTQILNSRGVSLLQFVLQWGRRFPELDLMLCGMKSHQQIDSALAAFETLLPEEIFLEVDSEMVRAFNSEEEKLR